MDHNFDATRMKGKDISMHYAVDSKANRLGVGDSGMVVHDLITGKN